MGGLTLEALEDQLAALDMRHIETRAMLYAYRDEIMRHMDKLQTGCTELAKLLAELSQIVQAIQREKGVAR